MSIKDSPVFDRPRSEELSIWPPGGHTADARVAGRPGTESMSPGIIWASGCSHRPLFPKGRQTRREKGKRPPLFPRFPRKELPLSVILVCRSDYNTCRYRPPLLFLKADCRAGAQKPQGPATRRSGFERPARAGRYHSGAEDPICAPCRWQPDRSPPGRGRLKGGAAAGVVSRLQKNGAGDRTPTPRWCGRWDLNPYARAHAPQTCLSAYSSTAAHENSIAAGGRVVNSFL